MQDMDIRNMLKRYFREHPEEDPKSLGKKVGVHFTQIYRIINKDCDPRLSTVNKLLPYINQRGAHDE